MERKVVITGLGLITPGGNDVKTAWQNLLKGKSGISRISRFDPSPFPVQIAGEIKDFNPTDKLDPKLAKRTDRFSQYALWATIEAVEDAGLNFDSLNRDNIGVVVGSGMGGLETWENEHKKFLSKGPSRVSPLLVPMMIPDMAAGQIAILYKVRGPNFATEAACASGAYSIGEAFRLIKNGDADVIIAGGTEAPVTAFSITAFSNMRALSKRNNEPEKASRPFDKDRDGFVVSEGAGIVILEGLEHALKRGAKIYGELCGYGASGDGYHLTAPDPEGDGAYIAMENAIEESGISKGEIDYINAHGTSTILNDITETKAIKRLFKDQAKKIAISSTKSMLGHTLGAAGAIECIVTVLSIYHQRVHPTLNLENPDPECDLDYVPGKERELKIRYALSNSLGFGGHNSTLIVGKYDFRI